MSFVPFYNDFEHTAFDKNFFYLSTDFQNICCTFCEKLDAQLCQENISSAFEQL